MLARGQQANGRIAVVSHQTAISDEITVDIVAESREWDILRGTAVCLMERKKGERGVGIFVSTSLSDTGYVLTSIGKTPKHPIWTRMKTDVDITFKIPHQPATPTLELPRFEVVAPNFQVTLPNADEVVNFHDLTIHTTNMQIIIGVRPP